MQGKQGRAREGGLAGPGSKREQERAAATHEVVVPLDVEMSAPLRAATTGPAHGRYSLKAVVSTPEPRVSEKKAERKPNMARAGATISSVVRPSADCMPWISPLRAVSLSITEPACSSSTSTHTCGQRCSAASGAVWRAV